MSPFFIFLFLSNSSIGLNFYFDQAGDSPIFLRLVIILCSLIISGISTEDAFSLVCKNKYLHNLIIN